jgi:hypothetical protein
VTAETTRDQDESAVTCWCCGVAALEHDVVRLGDHPEVAVCLTCTAYLRRRAREHAAGPFGRRMHRLGGRARDAVMRRGWHELPILGGLLRRLDRHLPW